MGKELLGSLELNRAYQMDCLEGMKLLPDKSIDMILCDLPYGTTACKWDTIIPFDKLWEQYDRIIKDRGAIVLFCKQPFTTTLINSNLKDFKYSLVWEKDNHDNPLMAKKRFLNITEDIAVFYKKQCTYNPQGIIPYNKKTKQGRGRSLSQKNDRNESYTQAFTNYPKNILKFKRDLPNVHPTQKPVLLFEYLIKTYTNEGEIVLDNCLGSGTTAIASTLTNRKWVGFETEPKYIEIINKRLDQIQLDNDIKDYE